MATKFRTLLAPIGTSTGDGRRFADDAITTADTPFPFEWARSREGGHDGAVQVGVVEDVFVGPMLEAVSREFIGREQVTGMDPMQLGVWARGELFEVDRETMPRLAEDVAEAMHLIERGTLGPSVDLDSFEGIPVFAGTNDPISFEAMEEGQKAELLVTAGRVRAATLVSIPAFAETSRPLELLPTAEPALHTDLALVASVGTAVTLRRASAFDRVLSGPTPMTYDFEAGEAWGHLALWQTCHVGYADVCVTPPRDPSGDFAAFNRYAIETDGGPVWAGRITAGGRHAGLSLAAGAAMSVHDDKETVAYVRAYADEYGIAVAGLIEPDLSEGTLAVLSRRKVSGDWRETRDGLSLIEVLALSPGPRRDSEPGFPVETFSRGGRQVALVASLSPDPAGFLEAGSFQPTDEQLDRIAALALEQMERREAAQELAALVKAGAEKERAALLAALA